MAHYDFMMLWKSFGRTDCNFGQSPLNGVLGDKEVTKKNGSFETVKQKLKKIQNTKKKQSRKVHTEVPRGMWYEEKPEEVYSQFDVDTDHLY
tara:strand:- start:152 stop:427 length:276 start_codon:yes stop_codon:yes gene_type:complete